MATFIKHNGEWVDVSGSGVAEDIAYDNTDSGLTADTVQDAIDEVNTKVNNIPTPVTPKGTVAFASLPALTNVEAGWMYNISDDFTTTSDFVISGIEEKAGSNVYCIEVSGIKKWDVFAAAAGGTVVVDQSYDANSTNAQSGTAVASAVSSKVDKVTGKGLSTNDFTDTLKNKLDGLTVDQTYSASSANAQSGKAVASAVSGKVDKVTGKGLSTNDFTDALKSKLDGLTVDQTYDASSTNAQSGKAVASALSGKQAAGSYKTTQAAVTDPTASGTTITAIDTISQNTNGVISATKKTIRSASTTQTGVVQLSSEINSSSETLAATAKAVKAAYDLASGKQAAGSYKTTQTAKTDPTASGNTITAIDTISQDTNGVITATKKTIRSASGTQTGVVQYGTATPLKDGTAAVGTGNAARVDHVHPLNVDTTAPAGLTAITGTSAVGSASTYARRDHTHSVSIRSASTSQTGIVQLNDTVTSTSTAQAATANAVKTVADRVGTLSSLTTTAKGSLVAAVNEVKNDANPTLESYSQETEGITFTRLKKGNVCQVTLSGTVIGSTGGIGIDNFLPLGWRPMVNTLVPIMNYDSSEVDGYLHVYTNGKVIMECSGEFANDPYRGSVTFLV